MAYIPIASVSVATATTSSAIDTTGADFLIAWAVSQAGGAPTDNKGNTWNPLTGYTGAFGEIGRFYYAANAIGGTGHTFTPSGSAPSLCVGAYMGSHSSPFDLETGANTQSSPASPGALTPSEDDCLVVGGCGTFGNAFSVGSPFTLIESEDGIGGGQAYGSALAHLIQTLAGLVNPAFSYSGGFTSGVAQASFKAAGGAAAFIDNTNHILRNIIGSAA